MWVLRDGYHRKIRFDISKSIRLDSECVAIINSLPGNTFSEKVRYLCIEYKRLLHLRG